jgi:ribosomal protein S6--L-glutamate ligase
VAELLIKEDSGYVGKALRDARFPEDDISVLSLHRGAIVIPNPRPDRVLEADDRLLCYGNLEKMRGLIPARRKRRAKVRELPDEPLGPEPTDTVTSG